ncbi:hypothetical protein [Methanolapillus ohkumae]
MEPCVRTFFRQCNFNKNIIFSYKEWMKICDKM